MNLAALDRHRTELPAHDALYETAELRAAAMDQARPLIWDAWQAAKEAANEFRSRCEAGGLVDAEDEELSYAVRILERLK